MGTSAAARKLGLVAGCMRWLLMVCMLFKAESSPLQLGPMSDC